MSSARLHLLHHRRLVAQLARVEHGNAQAAIGFLLQRFTKLQRGAVPRVPGGCDQAEAQFLAESARTSEEKPGRGGGKSGRRGLDELAAVVVMGVSVVGQGCGGTGGAQQRVARSLDQTK